MRPLGKHDSRRIDTATTAAVASVLPADSQELARDTAGLISEVTGDDRSQFINSILE